MDAQTHEMMSRRTPRDEPTSFAATAPASAATVDDLLGLKVSELIDTYPDTLPVLIEAGFTPLSFAPLRAALTPTVTLGQALRIQSLNSDSRQQLLVAPQGDEAETLFYVLEGEGFVQDGEQRHQVRVSDTVHVRSGARKALVAGDGRLTVMGVRYMTGANLG